MHWIKIDGNEISESGFGPVLPSGALEVSEPVSSFTHWVSNEVLVAYTPEQAVNKRAAIMSGMAWSNLQMQPQDPRTLADLKAAKNAAINAARLLANQSHFTFAGKQIAVDPLSRSDIDAMHGTVLMLQAMPAGWPGAWKAQDNTFVAIPDVATWGAFYGAMVAQGMQNFAHSQALKAQLDAATTPEEVEAVPVW